jgi:hypothetical protein
MEGWFCSLERVFMGFMRPSGGRTSFVCGRGWVWGYFCHQPVSLHWWASTFEYQVDSPACLHWIEHLWGQQEPLNILEPELGSACASGILLSCFGGSESISTLPSGENRAPETSYFSLASEYLTNTSLLVHVLNVRRFYKRSFFW